ncbi:MAG TPA: NAD(P)(+) transhydrogenase (Re/Si-specific) subunit beta [Polyangiaceae bacterium]|jgi:NAD(P) transhydrogenase subunit beta|nr:NAD(P)(+) transhydrogenase (Re/Si-specific) subunit beta [Polyangiaceae bacterium]
MESENSLIGFSYLVASVCFILTLQFLSSPKLARRGVLIGVFGMTVAVIGTLMKPEIVVFKWIIPGVLIGSLVGGAMSAWIPMTKMPERIALSHAFGGLAAALVGISEYVRHDPHELTAVTITALGFETFFGFLTFTGSLMAFGKLQGLISGRPITFPGLNAINIAAFIGSLVGLIVFVMHPEMANIFYGICAVGIVIGVTAVIPIGGADMPVVISLLNSYAGLSSSATGFAIHNNVLIIAGALDGTSGFILSMMMSKAMNRSFANVLFGAFGTGDSTAAATSGDTRAPQYNQGTIEDAASTLEAAQSVIVVPGYGLAVSQAQHAVRELGQILEKRGAKVSYAIHPVAGRMPGHMNVLLAEADVPYDQLFDIEDINDDFAQTDVVLVVGANDVVNPAAKTNKGSPIYGMPVFNVENSKTVIVLKRSMNTGFSGLDNELFYLPNTMVVLGDAKKTLQKFKSELETRE